MAIPVLYSQNVVWPLVLMLVGMAVTVPTFIYLSLASASCVRKGEAEVAKYRRLHQIITGVLVISTLVTLIGAAATILQITLRTWSWWY